MKDRKELIEYFADLDFKVGAEIGVANGDFSETICKIIPGVRLYCVDLWDRYKEYTDYQRENTFKRMYETTKAKLLPYDCVIIKEYSKEAMYNFHKEFFDFVYIDANHTYKYVKEDIAGWAEKVKPGGIVAGHDYWERENVGVMQAVDEYVQEHGYTLEITGEQGDEAPSWYFIK